MDTIWTVCGLGLAVGLLYPLSIVVSVGVIKAVCAVTKPTTITPIVQPLIDIAHIIGTQFKLLPSSTTI